MLGGQERKRNTVIGPRRHLSSRGSHLSTAVFVSPGLRPTTPAPHSNSASTIHFATVLLPPPPPPSTHHHHPQPPSIAKPPQFSVFRPVLCCVYLLLSSRHRCVSFLGMREGEYFYCFSLGTFPPLGIPGIVSWNHDFLCLEMLGCLCRAVMSGERQWRRRHGWRGHVSIPEGQCRPRHCYRTT